MSLNRMRNMLKKKMFFECFLRKDEKLRDVMNLFFLIYFVFLLRN